MSELHQVFSRRFPSELAERCVKCGMCLPYCPTYALAKQEGDSPRGRISLMQGLASGQLDPSPALLGHLDGCLTCRSCEHACPADVPYGQLIDAARTGLAESGRPGSRFARLVAWILVRPALARCLAACMRVASRIGLRSLAVRVGPAKSRRLVARFPKAARSWHGKNLPSVPSGGEAVHLFHGCVTPLVDAATLEDATRVLSAMGFEVLCHGGQTCCGALYQHAGARHEAAALARENHAAFAAVTTPILGLASGCTATLSEYGSQFGGPEMAIKNVYDVIHWISDHQDRLPPLALTEPVTAVLHKPCTLRNVLRETDRLGTLLDSIRNLSWRPLEAPHNCCGGAGAYMLTQPGVADALGEQHVLGLRADPPDRLLTGNIGCAVHLQAALTGLQLNTRVEHPVSLIARALPS